MNYGAGRPDLTGLLQEPSPRGEDRWLSHLDPDEQLRKFIPQNLAAEDWLVRKRVERARELDSVPEPEIFCQLINTNSTRTVRKLVNQSRWLRGSPILRSFLLEVPERFLSIKASPRFPQSLDGQIEFLTRGIAAVVAGYKPSTGHKYLRTLIHRCEECQKPAIAELDRDSKVDPLGQRSLSRSGQASHTPDQCRYSTWPCPAHHPFHPSFTGRHWCGTC
jgi:hypothetical protein